MPSMVPWLFFKHHTTSSRGMLMSELDQTPPEPQSGKKVALGIFGFMVGVIVLLLLVKYIFGL